jgi:hypothetical protein
VNARKIIHGLPVPAGIGKTTRGKGESSVDFGGEPNLAGRSKIRVGIMWKRNSLQAFSEEKAGFAEFECLTATPVLL